MVVAKEESNSDDDYSGVEEVYILFYGEVLIPSQEESSESSEGEVVQFHNILLIYFAF